MAALDPRIEAVRVQYGLAASDFWELPQKKGTWVAKHAALEVAAVKAKITFAAPMVLEANGEAKSAALCVTGTMGDRTEWSIGEASPANNKNSYPYAMAEKRGKDRVILKLIGIHGIAYSEDEADDFKQPANGGAREKAGDYVAQGAADPGTRAPAPALKQDQDIEEGVRNWTAQRREEIDAAARLPDLYQWQDQHEAALHRLKSKHKSAYDGLMKYFQDKFEILSKKEAAE